MHRLVPGFVIQGGGFFVTNRLAAPEIAEVEDFGMITNEFGVGARVSNVFGTIAMAKLGGNPHSASSQWFFNLTNNAANPADPLNLDNQNGGFTVFGRVVAGTNVLERFNRFGARGTTNLVVRLDNGVFSSLPVLSNRVAFADLIYTDIRRVQQPALGWVPQAEGGWALTWPGLGTLVQRIESASEYGGAWSRAVETNGPERVARWSLPPLAPGEQRFFRLVIPPQ
jgi:cyclophilin family peptidyl-prolyl cis-trans isomerase